MAMLLPSCVATLAQTSPAGDLVVMIVGSKQYHQPSCPLVARAGSQVRVMKLCEAKGRGLPAHACPSAPASAAAADPNKIRVFSQPNDNKYHSATCPKLGSNR